MTFQSELSHCINRTVKKHFYRREEVDDLIASNPGPQGDPGPAGADGDTPYIGGNGNWWIGAVDTGVQAQGPQGDPGQDGAEQPHTMIACSELPSFPNATQTINPGAWTQYGGGSLNVQHEAPGITGKIHITGNVFCALNGYGGFTMRLHQAGSYSNTVQFPNAPAATGLYMAHFHFRFPTVFQGISSANFDVQIMPNVSSVTFSHIAEAHGLKNLEAFFTTP